MRTSLNRFYSLVQYRYLYVCIRDFLILCVEIPNSQKLRMLIHSERLNNLKLIARQNFLTVIVAGSGE